jgi:ATP-dependent DNA helicase DinG
MTDSAALNPEDLKVARALGGTISGVDLLRAHVQETGGETRPQQENMATAVAEAIDNQKPLLAQAGTGTGKSLAYLFPAAAAGKRTVIATATNQLSEQLVRHDLPQVQQTLLDAGAEFEFALLKGRNNYACMQKISELEKLENDANASGNGSDSLFDFEPDDDTSSSRRAQARQDGALVAELVAWSKTTDSGDRTEAPVVADRVWNQISTSSADCPGAWDCPFGQVCFAEKARATAKAADVVVTNHALLAQEIKTVVTGVASPDTTEKGGVFGKHDIVIVDEAHDLPDALTGALTTEVDPRAISKFLTKANRHVDDSQVTDGGDSLTVEKARIDLEDLTDAMESIPTGQALENLDPIVNDRMTALVTRILLIERMLAAAAASAQKADKPKRASALNILAEQANRIADSLNTARTVAPGFVRWAEQRSIEYPPVLKTAPLEVGAFLNKALAGRTLVATSATLTVANDFTPIQRVLGLDNGTCTTLDVGSPFNYPQQGMLYIPKAPFPEPVGKDRTAHTEAVLEEVLHLVESAGGRTLALFTTTASAQKAAAYLREHLPHLTVHAHGDAPADVLVRQFAEEETSVLCATMGLWQGTNVPGPSCSLVIIDKVGFAPIDDVLTAARRSLADSRRRDGFSEVVVAQAATSLAQATGRLIRTATDKGVVAILDPRLHTKGYGRTLIASLPPFKVYTDRDIVTGALIRLTGGTTDAHRAQAPKTTPSAASTTVGSPKRQGVPKRASSTRNLAKSTKPLRPKKID